MLSFTPRADLTLVMMHKLFEYSAEPIMQYDGHFVLRMVLDCASDSCM